MTEPVAGLFPPHLTQGDGWSTSGTWFGPAERPLAGWWTAPASPSRNGVVIAAPLGYEYWSAYRSLRTLAESLGGAGWHVLRFDWDGTGNSSGHADDPDRLTAWRASLAHAVSAMREQGVTRVVLVGVRFGATLALHDAAALGVDQVVACAPVTSGRQWLRELRMLGITDPGDPDTVMYSGLTVNAEGAAQLTGIDLVKAPPPRIARTMLVTRSDPSDGRLTQALRADGGIVDLHACDAMRSMLDAPAGEDRVPDNWIAPIIAWLGPPPTDAGGSARPSRDAHDIPWLEGTVRASFATIERLAAVCTEPVGQPADTVVVFLNSGADPLVGPGRAWVDYARALALRGYACIQTDFLAFGESPDEGRSPGRPYDPHCVDDTRRLVSALRQRYRRVVLAGLCVGAWIAMRAAESVHVDGIFALNPLLWWRPGLPIIIRVADTVAWRAPMRRRQHRLARFGIWSLLDVVGVRPPASRWLIALRRRKIPVMLSYAEGDDGLAHLRDCCARRLVREQRSGWLTLEEVPGIDHPMFRLWRRPAIVDQLTRFLAALPANPRLA